MTTEPLTDRTQVLTKGLGHGRGSVYILQQDTILKMEQLSPLLHLVLTQAAHLAWNSGCKSVTQFYSLLG